MCIRDSSPPSISCESGLFISPQLDFPHKCRCGNLFATPRRHWHSQRISPWPHSVPCGMTYLYITMSLFPSLVTMPFITTAHRNLVCLHSSTTPNRPSASLTAKVMHSDQWGEIWGDLHHMQTNHIPTPNLDGKPVTWKKSMKYLGVTTDSHLSFTDHVQSKLQQVHSVRAKIFPLILHRGPLSKLGFCTQNWPYTICYWDQYSNNRQP